MVRCQCSIVVKYENITCFLVPYVRPLRAKVALKLTVTVLPPTLLTRTIHCFCSHSPPHALPYCTTIHFAAIWSRPVTQLLRLRAGNVLTSSSLHIREGGLALLLQTPCVCRGHDETDDLMQCMIPTRVIQRTLISVDRCRCRCRISLFHLFELLSSADICFTTVLIKRCGRQK